MSTVSFVTLKVTSWVKLAVTVTSKIGYKLARRFIVSVLVSLSSSSGPLFCLLEHKSQQFLSFSAGPRTIEEILSSPWLDRFAQLSHAGQFHSTLPLCNGSGVQILYLFGRYAFREGIMATHCFLSLSLLLISLLKSLIYLLMPKTRMIRSPAVSRLLMTTLGSPIKY